MNMWKSLQLPSAFVSFCMNLWKFRRRASAHRLHMVIDANTDVDLVNSDDTPHKVTVTPLQCCLFIEENDIDCEVCKIYFHRNL